MNQVFISTPTTDGRNGGIVTQRAKSAGDIAAISHHSLPIILHLWTESKHYKYADLFQKGSVAHIPTISKL